MEITQNKQRVMEKVLKCFCAWSKLECLTPVDTDILVFYLPVKPEPAIRVEHIRVHPCQEVLDFVTKHATLFFKIVAQKRVYDIGPWQMLHSRTKAEPTFQW